MSAKKIYENMTYVQLLYLNTSSLLDFALQGKLTRKEFLEAKEEILRMAGESDPNPFRAVTITPFVKHFFSIMDEWIEKKDGNSLIELIQVYSGAQTFEHTGIIEQPDKNQKSSPKWHQQTLEIGEMMLGEKNENSSQEEKIGALLRNIPIDTAIGFTAHLFLTKLLSFHDTNSKETIKKKSPDNEIQTLWDFLNGKRNLPYNLSIKGMYIVFEVNLNKDLSAP